jgi:circadian clock protein KaiC
VAIFEELPPEFSRRAARFGIDFDTPQKDGMLMDLSVDEIVYAIVGAVKEINAKRVVIEWWASRWRPRPTSATSFANRCTG